MLVKVVLAIIVIGFLWYQVAKYVGYKAREDER